MHRVVSAIDLAEGHPSFLIPVFLSDRSNVPYVQSMDEYLMIEAFLPFYKLDKYPSLAISESVEAAIRGPGILVYRGCSGEVNIGTIECVYEYYDKYREELKKHPLLQMQITRIVSDLPAIQYNSILAASDRYFNEPSQRAMWLDSSVELAQKNDSIWKKINEHKKSIETEMLLFDVAFFESMDDEQIFQYLNSNMSFLHWGKLWFYLFERRPNDERLLRIAQRWIFFKFSPGENPTEAMNVFCASVDRMASVEYQDRDFVDFLYEHTASLLLFSDQLVNSTHIKRRILQIIKFNMDQYDYRELILRIFGSTFFGQQETYLLGSELVENLSSSNPSLSSGEVTLLKDVIPKLERYSYNREFANIVRALKSSMRAGDGAHSTRAG